MESGALGRRMDMRLSILGVLLLWVGIWEGGVRHFDLGESERSCNLIYCLVSFSELLGPAV